MATANEILATMAEEAAANEQAVEVCTIDRCTRAVAIPEALRIVGVESDNNVTRRVFKVACAYRGTDLSTFGIRINFMNANQEKDVYIVTDARREGDHLVFTWVLSRKALRYKGKLQFIACMVCDGGTDDEREWNSTLGEFSVLEGLEVELTGGEVYQTRDVLDQLLALVVDQKDEALAAVSAAGAAQERVIEAKGAETLASIPKEYAALTQDVAALTEEINEGKIQIRLKPVAALNVVDGYKAYMSLERGLISQAAAAKYSYAIYPVKKGNEYQVYGYGYDRETFYVAYIGESNFVADGAENAKLITPIACGGDAYPDDYKYHAIDFVAESDGYLYVNYQTDGEMAQLNTPGAYYDAMGLSVVQKNGNVYTHFTHAYGNVFVERTFKHTNANDLFQLYHIGIGTFENGKFVETKDVMTATTDIVGPISIGRVSDKGAEAGIWAGGNHDVSVNGIRCKTAKEASFAAYCDGVDITNAPDGIYVGKVTFVCENNIYFPQTITSENLDSATKAITEIRTYTLDSQMRVKVDLAFEEKASVAGYYGMQMVLFPDIAFVQIPGAEQKYSAAELTNGLTVAEENRHYYLSSNDGWNYDMTLDNVGLGNFAKVADTEWGYGNISNGKIYFRLIRFKQINAGKTVTWCGNYNIYHD